MSDCDPCGNESPRCDPPDESDILYHITGRNRRGCEVGLPAAIGVLAARNGKPWKAADGSASQPIQLNLQVDNRGSRYIVFMRGDGTLVAYTPPSDELGSRTVVYRSGAFTAIPTGQERTEFDETQIESAMGCNYGFAVFERCDGQQVARLRRLSLAQFRELLGCGADTVDTLDSLLGCGENGPTTLTMPDNVNSVPVPGVWARCQDGKIRFLAAPVDSTTGIVKAGYALRTPTTPAVGAANCFEWSKDSGFTILATRKHVATLVYGIGSNLPDEPNTSASSGSASGSVTLESIGLSASAKGVIVRGAVQIAIPLSPAEIRASVKVNGTSIVNAWALQGSGGANAAMCECHIPVTGGSFTYELVATSSQPSVSGALAKLEVIGAY